jgi:hypothetical protein
VIVMAFDMVPSNNALNQTTLVVPISRHLIPIASRCLGVVLSVAG